MKTAADTLAQCDEISPQADRRWLTPGAREIGTASLPADVGHEVPTALLPSPVSAMAGVLWTAISAQAAFGYLAAWMPLALAGFAIGLHGGK